MKQWQEELLKEILNYSTDPVICSTCKYCRRKEEAKDIGNFDYKMKKPWCALNMNSFNKAKKLGDCDGWEICNQTIINPQEEK